MPGATTSTFSPRRLGVGLAVQAAVMAVDVALSANPLTITGSVLLVPLVLAVIGDWREVAITGAVAFAIGVASNLVEHEHGPEPGRLPRRLLHGLRGPRGARRPDPPAGDGDGRRQRGARRRAERHARAARRHPRRAGRGGHRERRARPRSTRIQPPPSCSASTSVDEVLAAAPEELAGRFTITDEDGGPSRRRHARATADGRGGRAPAPHPQRARRRQGILAAHQGVALPRRLGRPPGHQRHRGRDRGQGRGAARALPGRGGPAPRVVARLRADARARGPHGRPPARRLVRSRHARRRRRAAAGRRRPRRPSQGRAGA